MTSGIRPANPAFLAWLTIWIRESSILRPAKVYLERSCESLWSSRSVRHRHHRPSDGFSSLYAGTTAAIWWPLYIVEPAIAELVASQTLDAARPSSPLALGKLRSITQVREVAQLVQGSPRWDRDRDFHRPL